METHPQPKKDRVITITGERVTLGGSSTRNQEDHVARYNFAITNYDVGGKTVLDIACGTGYGTYQIAKAGAVKVYGVDIDSKTIESAKKEFFAPNIEYICGSAGDPHFPPNIFDLIVSYETIEHLENSVRAAYLDELYRSLKPNGALLLSTPNRLITSPWGEQPTNPFHVLEYTKSELEAELNAHGFMVESWKGQRFVSRWKTVSLVRKSSRLIEKLFGIRLNWYDIADGAMVRQLLPSIEPRYFVLTCKKNV